MENRLKDLNKTLNRMMSTEERFTDKQKLNIRNAIAKKRKNRFSFLHAHWKPIMSIAVCLLLFIAVGQVAMDNFKSSEQQVSESNANEGAATHSAEDSSGSIESSGSSPDKTMPALDEDDKDGTGKEDFSIAEKSNAEQKIISGPLLPIEDRLVSVYEQLKADQDQAALKGLEPFEVMQIYYHAEQQKDHETKYTMYYQDPAGSMPSKQQYLEEVAQDPVINENAERNLQHIKDTEKFTLVIQETPMDRKEANITWGGTGESMKFFRLVRDETKDIWAVSWLPSQ